MSDRTLQAIYQALNDQNLRLTFIEPNCQAPATQLLELLPPNAYWALVQIHESRGLLALYRLAPNPHDHFPSASSLLEDPRVQVQACRLATTLQGDGPWWVLLSARPQPELKPPCRSGAATDLGSLPVDESLVRLAQAWAELPSDRPGNSRQQELGEAAPTRSPSDDIQSCLEVDVLSVELGSGLLPLVLNEAPLLARFAGARRHLARELGLELPGVRVRDNPSFKPFEAVLKIRDVPVARSELREGHLLCVGPEALLEELGGDLVVDPTYGMLGRWVLPEQGCRLKQNGAIVLCHVSTLVVQLLEACRDYAPELLTLEMARRRLRAPALSAATTALEKRGIDEVALWHLMRDLLRERVSVRDLTTILQSLLDNGEEPALAKARRGLARQITSDNLSEDGKLYALVVKPDDEQQLLGPAPEATALRLVEHLQDRARSQIYLTSAEGRMRVSAQLRKFSPACQVLAPEEIAPGTTIVDLA